MDSTGGGTSVGVREKSPIQHDGYEEQPHGCPEFCPPRTTVTPKIFPSKVTCKQSQALLWMKLNPFMPPKRIFHNQSG